MNQFNLKVKPARRNHTVMTSLQLTPNNEMRLMTRNSDNTLSNEEKGKMYIGEHLKGMSRNEEMKRQ